MGLFRTALAIASLLLIPAASADYSFSFSSRDQFDHSGASASAELSGGPSGEADDSLGTWATASGFGGVVNNNAAPDDSASDCFDSNPPDAYASRATQACLLASDGLYSKLPLIGKAFDPYALVGSQDLTKSYPPYGFGGPPTSGMSGNDGGSRSSGSGGTAGTPTASSDDHDKTARHSDGTSDHPFRFHSRSHGRGSDIISIGATDDDGIESLPHHHHGGGGNHGGDTSTSLLDTTDAPTRHHRRDPPVVITPTDLNPTVDVPVVTGPSVNVGPVAQPIPEPGTLVLVGLALVAIAVARRRKL